MIVRTIDVYPGPECDDFRVSLSVLVPAATAFDAAQKISALFDGQTFAQPEAKAEETPADKPKRGRRAAKAAKAEEAPAPKAEEAPAPKAEETPAEKPKRGRRAKTEKPAISDEDLMRAASELAAKTDPNVVMEILTEDYGVEKVNDVPADMRQILLDEFARNMEDDD